MVIDLNELRQALRDMGQEDELNSKDRTDRVIALVASTLKPEIDAMELPFTPTADYETKHAQVLANIRLYESTLLTVRADRNPPEGADMHSARIIALKNKIAEQLVKFDQVRRKEI